MNTRKTKYCWVRLYRNEIEMQKAYEKMSFDNIQVLGAHCAYTRQRLIRGRWVSLGETGTVFLSYKNCGAGIVSHEFMHAILWAWRYSKGKKNEDYPVVIKDMREEERLLHNLSYALIQFWTWYWKIEKSICR